MRAVVHLAVMVVVRGVKYGHLFEITALFLLSRPPPLALVNELAVLIAAARVHLTSFLH